MPVLGRGVGAWVGLPARPGGGCGAVLWAVLFLGERLGPCAGPVNMGLMQDLLLLQQNGAALRAYCVAYPPEVPYRSRENPNDDDGGP